MRAHLSLTWTRKSDDDVYWDFFWLTLWFTSSKHDPFFLRKSWKLLALHLDQPDRWRTMLKDIIFPAKLSQSLSVPSWSIPKTWPNYSTKKKELGLSVGIIALKLQEGTSNLMRNGSHIFHLLPELDNHTVAIPSASSTGVRYCNKKSTYDATAKHCADNICTTIENGSCQAIRAKLVTSA